MPVEQLRPAESDRASFCRVYGLAALAALALGGAWLLPASILAAILGWSGTLFLVALVRQEKSALPALMLTGLLTTIIGFYWIPDSVNNLYEIDGWPLWLLSAAFFCWSAFQFTLFGIVFRTLPRTCDLFGLRAPLAWIAVSTLWPAIFSWQLAHTQLRFLPFVQIAEFGGAELVTFLFVWVTEALLISYQRKSLSPFSMIPLVGFIVSIGMRLRQRPSKTCYLCLFAF